MLEFNKVKNYLKLSKQKDFIKKIPVLAKNFRVKCKLQISRAAWICGKGIKKIGTSYIKPWTSKIRTKLSVLLSPLVKKLNPLKDKLIEISNHSFIKKNRKYLIWVGRFVIVVLVLSSALIIRNYMARSTVPKYVITDNKAEERFYEGDYAGAISEYAKISEKDNGAPKWDVDIAEIYSVKGDVENSRKFLQVAKDKVKTKQIKDGELLNHLIFTEFMNKDYKIAFDDGVEALKVAPTNKNLLKTMFTVYMANNQLEEAKALILNYKVNKKSAYDTAEYARMLMIVNEWESGLGELKKAWDIDKDDFKVYDILAQISVYNRDVILEKVSNLLVKDPTNLAYKMWLAKIYSLSDDTSDQAIKMLDSIRTEKTGKVVIKLIEASTFQNLKQNDKADAIITQVIKDNNNDYRVLHAAGWFYLNRGETVKAMDFCKKSIVKNKEYPDNYGFLMPEILKAQNKSLEGEPYFRTALLREPYNYNIMINIANYYWYTTKSSEKALEYFKFAEIIKPQEAEIKYSMALIHLTNKREQEAIDLLKQCIKIDEMVPKYHRTLGTIYMTKGSTAEGIKEIRYAYHADEADISTLNNAGCYYITVDMDLDRAYTNFQAAVQGIKSNTDKYTADTIKENYNKLKAIMDKYKNGKDNETIKIPDFVLFY
jgi:tetratricopeptide (TPR) repeat protein